LSQKKPEKRIRGRSQYAGFLPGAVHKIHTQIRRICLTGMDGHTGNERGNTYMPTERFLRLSEKKKQETLQEYAFFAQKKKAEEEKQKINVLFG